jgi:hypothetical protein
MSYFLGSKRWYETVWGSRDLASGGTLVSRASIFLNYSRSQIPSRLARDSCKVLSPASALQIYLPPQPCRSSKIASKSAKSVFDFLRLAGELVENFGNVINGMLPLMEMVCYRLWKWYVTAYGNGRQPL